MAMMMDHARVKLDAGNVIQIQLDSQVEVNMVSRCHHKTPPVSGRCHEQSSSDLEFSVSRRKVVQRPYTIPENTRRWKRSTPAIRGP